MANFIILKLDGYFKDSKRILLICCFATSNHSSLTRTYFRVWNNAESMAKALSNGWLWWTIPTWKRRLEKPWTWQAIFRQDGRAILWERRRDKHKIQRFHDLACHWVWASSYSRIGLWMASNLRVGYLNSRREIDNIRCLWGGNYSDNGILVLDIFSLLCEWGTLIWKHRWIFWSSWQDKIFYW